MLAPYRHPYNKALGIVANLDHSIMHCCASAQADALSLTFISPDERIDTLFMKHQGQLAEKNKDILRQIVLAVEFLTKQGLSFRGCRDDRVNYGINRVNYGINRVNYSINRGNFIATLLGSMGSAILPTCT